MIYTKTIIVKSTDFDKDVKSLDENGRTFYLPKDLQNKLDAEIQHIYKKNRKCDILSMTITPTIAYFVIGEIAVPIPVRYDIVYVYKSDEV